MAGAGFMAGAHARERRRENRVTCGRLPGDPSHPPGTDLRGRIGKPHPVDASLTSPLPHPAPVTSPPPRQPRPIRLRFLLLLGLPLAAAACSPPPTLSITFLDVGQADAILVQAPGGHTALIDAGRGSATVGKVRSRGVSHINLLVASHPDADHIGGLDEVVESLPVGAWMASGRKAETQVYQDLADALARRPAVTHLEAVPRTIHLGSATIEVLPPLPNAPSDNDASVALAVRYGGFAALLTGDAETAAINHLLRRGAVPQVTVLKASHHGSDNGVTGPLLEVARPDVVVIQVGRGNAYQLPDSAALARYEAAAREVYRTDLDGAVTVRGFRDGSYRIVLGR